MTVKHAEGSFVGLCNSIGLSTRKFGDVRYCIVCGAAQPKSEQAPDYIASPIAIWVDCKNSAKDGVWDWKNDIGPEGKRKNQRKWLWEHSGWLFIELGRGRVHPDRERSGRSGYLVPMIMWLLKIEPLLIDKGQFSIRKETWRDRKGGDYYLDEWRLDWEPGTGWVIPVNHDFWFVLHSGAQRLLSLAKKNIKLEDGKVWIQSN